MEGKPDKKNLSPRIEHSLLRPDASEKELRRLCEEAKRFGFGAVCINPFYVPLAVTQLEGTDTKVCSTVAFPMGAATLQTKVFETKQAIENGAKEIDFVINFSNVRNKYFDKVQEEISAVQFHCFQKNIILKAVLEMSLMTKGEVRELCRICAEVKVNFVKTCSGYLGGEANPHSVGFLRELLPLSIGIKAAGSIRTYKQAMLMINAGASRIGSSSGVRIVK